LPLEPAALVLAACLYALQPRMLQPRREELDEHDPFDEGVFCRSRFWLFLSYVVSFASIIGSVAVLPSPHPLAKPLSRSPRHTCLSLSTEIGQAAAPVSCGAGAAEPVRTEARRRQPLARRRGAVPGAPHTGLHPRSLGPRALKQGGAGYAHSGERSAVLCIEDAQQRQQLWRVRRVLGVSV